MTPIEARALRLIIKHGPITCANLGDHLWPDKPRPSSCSCPFARPAGAVVKRLKARGLVERDYSSRVLTLYVATRAGREEAQH
ncbi:MAG: winged helix-turn-helix transcriptional regulator [Candidatus Eremiobacteraeota bacterium]|nr:winged helix-turn-helix transcriptional regulator [Candidatus Eremiobacteraeota bacterium]